MDSNDTSLDEFLTNANTILIETERNLEKLAQAALLNDTSSPHASRLQRLSQHLWQLAERSHTLRDSLHNGLETPPIDEAYWPLVRVLQSQEEEQTQLARELEDRLGQLLANSVFELASCRHLLGHDVEALSQGLESLQAELEQGLADARWFIADLEPATILGNFGLGGGVRRYLERFETRTNLTVHFHVQTNIGRLPSIIETTIFRVIQEALNNVHCHAEATRIDVTFEADETALKFHIIDNGRGIVTDDIGQGRKNLGLARMVDYAELLNGQLKILSDPGKGTHVTLTVPYPSL